MFDPSHIVWNQFAMLAVSLASLLVVLYLLWRRIVGDSLQSLDESSALEVVRPEVRHVEAAPGDLQPAAAERWSSEQPATLSA